MGITIERINKRECISNQKNKFLDLYVKLIKEHQFFANKVNFNDLVVENYDMTDAEKHYNNLKNIDCLIFNNGEVVGCISYIYKNGYCLNDDDILFIKGIYIINNYRNKGIASTVLKEIIKSNSSYRIELECYYCMPANKLYKELGFKTMYTKYFYKD